MRQRLSISPSAAACLLPAPRHVQRALSMITLAAASAASNRLSLLLSEIQEKLEVNDLPEMRGGEGGGRRREVLNSNSYSF